MRSRTPASEIPDNGASKTTKDGLGPGIPSPAPRATGDRERAALGPIPESVSVAENPLPSARPDSRVEAQGRRTLSTAFVRVGPDGHLTVELRNGRVLVLRDVVMRPRDYCGVQVLGVKAGAQYCGGYAEVAAARPGGGAPAPEEPEPASSPAKSPRNPTKQN